MKFSTIPFIIAEAGVNHNGDLRLAERLVDAAASAGADAVKFQTFRTERLVTTTAAKAEYQARATGAKGGQYAMLKKLELSESDHRVLMRRCRKKGILFLSTPFDEESADLLARLGLTMFKISSGDLTNLPFLAHIARKKRPIILSTGMGNLTETRTAVQCIRRAGNPELTLLHCVSNYPTDPADANLRAMETLRQAFRVTVGFSDHTLGIEVSVAAAALGAAVIEKHFTLNKALKGPDHHMSLNPQELTALVSSVRNAVAALGDGRKQARISEKPMLELGRRSIVLAKDLPAGARLEKNLLLTKRPGTGISPAQIPQVIGRRLCKSVKGDIPLRWDMLLAENAS